MTKRWIRVVGGRIGGLVGAITAAEAGCRVRLMEARTELGGRARSRPPPYGAAGLFRLSVSGLRSLGRK
jgi:phytoene dehydrogenase-like protein